LKKEEPRTVYDFVDDLPDRLKSAPAASPDPRRYLLAIGVGDYDEVPDR
jgi:hypothetical protein